MIAVKHGRRKGFRLIRDRLTYGRRIPWRTSKREIKRGRDITWELRAMPAPDWVVEQWPGSATIIAVRSHGTREGKPQDETRYYVGSPEKVNLESASKKETRLSPQPDHHAAAI